MHDFKARIFALVLIVVSVVLVYINWRQLLHEGRYSMKMAAFGPVIGIGGVYLMLFPILRAFTRIRGEVYATQPTSPSASQAIRGCTL